MPVLSYGQVSWFDQLKIFFTLCRLPAAILYRLVLSPFLKNDRGKSWSRVASDQSFRYISSRLRVNQMQYIMGTTPNVYKTWAKKNNKTTMIEDSGNGGNVLWFTQSQTKRVLLYVHGGTYQLPMQGYAPPFWLSILAEMKIHTGEDIAFAALSYSLYPTAKFPTQLAQAISAIKHLVSKGFRPADLCLVGDSAGAALILQILSHILHPHPDVPKLELDHPISGVFLMSPWVSLSTNSTSFATNSDSDVLPRESWGYLASGIIQELPDTGVPYLEAVRAPDYWWKDIKKCVNTISIYAGELECLRDDILTLANKLQRDHDSVHVMVQSGGVHTDPYLNRLAGEKDDVHVKEFIWRFLQNH